MTRLGRLPSRCLAAILVLCAQSCGRPEIESSFRKPVRATEGTVIRAAGTYATIETTIRLSVNAKDVWVVEVLGGDGKPTFSQEHGSYYSRWFGYVASPRTFWFYSGDVGTKRLVVQADGTTAFDGFSPRMTDEEKRAFVASMPEGYYKLLPHTSLETYAPYRAQPEGEADKP